MTTLHPEWCAELLAEWSRSDLRGAQQDLGLPSVCPSFKGLVETSSELDVTGYTPAEVQAIAAGVEYLHLRHPEMYRVLCRHFRPWMRAKMPAQDGDEQLLPLAVQAVAKYVDEVLG